MPHAQRFIPFGRREIDQSITSRFAEQVSRFPERPAVVTSTASWSYETLDEITDRLAASLLFKCGPQPGAIGLLMDQGQEAVFAILAILKAGKFFVPLDPAQPPTLLTDHVRAAQPEIVLAGERYLGTLDSAVPVALLESVQQLPGGVSVDRQPTPESLAYVFFTSGSTGSPKGVMDCHRNVLHNVLRYTNNLKITARDRLSLIQSPSFSGTVSSLFTALLNGAAVCPFDVRSEGFEALSAWANDVSVTVFHSVPAIFRGLVAGKRRFPSVRVVRLEGDQALPRDVALYRESFGPECVLAIGLGATETGLSCQYLIRQTSKYDPSFVPLGYPTDDMSVAILDEDGNEQENLVVGEIAIRSRYLALGYWRRPELNETAFVRDATDPSVRIYRTGDRGRLHQDGCLEFLGRHHDRPRVNGQYVEVGEIESALQTLVGIQQAAVVGAEESSGSTGLVAFLIADDEQLTPFEIRNELSLLIPYSIVPRRYVFLAALPLTENGKTDRSALARLTRNWSGSSGEYHPPANDFEARLTGIWEEELGLAAVGVTDNFFDLGGDSLVAARICAEVERVTGSKFPPESLGLYPTISGLAGALDGPGGDRDTRTIMTFRAEGNHAPIYFVHDHFGRISWYGPLARKLGPDQPCFGIRVATDSHPPSAFNTIESLAAYYLDAIRSVQPSGPFHLAGLCFGGVVAFEMAQQARTRGDDVGCLALVAVSPYDFPGAVTPMSAVLWRAHAGAARLRHRSTDAFLSLVEALRTSLRLAESISHPSDARKGLAKSGTIQAKLSSMFIHYRWQPYAGPLDLFLEADFGSRYTPTGKCWQALSDVPPTVHLIPHRISEMFTVQNVDELASGLRSILRERTAMSS